MKKFGCMLLLVVMIFCVFGGCSANKNYVNDTNVSLSIPREEALEIGKQEAVNHFCLEENVSKLKMVYGTEDVTKEDDGGWKVHLLGHYYPVDAYGMVGENTRFAFTVHIDKSGDVVTTFEY